MASMLCEGLLRNHSVLWSPTIFFPVRSGYKLYKATARNGCAGSDDTVVGYEYAPALSRALDFRTSVDPAFPRSEIRVNT